MDCQKETFSGGRSIPNVPRDSIMPSASSRISSKWVNPWTIQVTGNQQNNKILNMSKTNLEKV